MQQVGRITYSLVGVAYAVSGASYDCMHISLYIYIYGGCQKQAALFICLRFLGPGFQRPFMSSKARHEDHSGLTDQKTSSSKTVR